MIESKFGPVEFSASNSPPIIIAASEDSAPADPLSRSLSDSKVPLLPGPLRGVAKNGPWRYAPGVVRVGYVCFNFGTLENVAA